MSALRGRGRTHESNVYLDRTIALALIKPDGVEKGVVGDAINRFQSAGLRVIGIKMLLASSASLRKHYPSNKEWLIAIGGRTKEACALEGLRLEETDLEIGEKIRYFLIRDMTAGPIIALALEGDNASHIAKEIVGTTEPRTASPESIRGGGLSDTYVLAYREGRSLRNLIHISDADAAEREFSLWFLKGELFRSRRDNR